MKQTQLNNQWKKVAGLGGMTLIIILALVIPNSEIFQANISPSLNPINSLQNLKPSADTCQSMNVIVLPQNPLPENTSAVIAITTIPENFEGTFTYSASSGNFNDENKNIGSYIETSAKKVNFSGGNSDTNLTIQAMGEINKNCLVTIPIVKTNQTVCSFLKIVSEPNPLPQNQSAILTLIPTPENFEGTYLFQAQSGEFQIQDADISVNGNHTKTLITKSTNVLYNGGNSGEKIVVKALTSDKNNNCLAEIPITK